MTFEVNQLNDELEATAARLGLTIEVGLEEARVPVELDDTCLLVRTDNLSALKGMLSSGLSAGFCYIDPPYNTGNSFLYDDKRRSTAPSIWGSHKPWMEFMLPRLAYAKRVLTKDGVIAISIDDYAYAHLKILMDNVFGEQCCLGTLVVTRSTNGLGSNRNVSDMHEYVVLYGRSEEALLRGVPEGADRKYEKRDEHGFFTIDGLFRKKGEASLREDRPNMFYPLYVSSTGEVFTEKVSANLKEVFPRDSKGVDRRWLWGKEKASLESWKLFASANGVVYVKSYHEYGKKVKLKSILAKPTYLTEAATREIKAIYGEKLFDTPKPLALIKDLISVCAKPDDTVLDFFAGSGTTGEAVAALNQEERASRHVILVEHDSRIPVRHAAVKAGFNTTADLTEFRLKKTAENYPRFTYQVVTDSQREDAPQLRAQEA